MSPICFSHDEMHNRLEIASQSLDELSLVQLALTLRPEDRDDHEIILALARRGKMRVDYVLAALVADCTRRETDEVQLLCAMVAHSEDAQRALRQVFASQLRKPPLELLRIALQDLDSGAMDIHTLQWILNPALSADEDHIPAVSDLLKEWLCADKKTNADTLVVRSFIFYVARRLQERVGGQ